MSEPAWSMPMNRAELIARVAALEAALREAVEYVSLDSETPSFLHTHWKRVLAASAPETLVDLKDPHNLAESRVKALESALRGVVMEGKAYAAHHTLEHCAQAMYDIASGALTNTDLMSACPPKETPAEWGCSWTTNNGDRCVLPAGHGGNHSL